MDHAAVMCMGERFAELPDDPQRSVDEGEQVVTSAQFMLDSESKLREAIQKMLNPTRAETPDKAAADDDDLFGDDNSEDLFGDDEKKATQDTEDLFN